MKKNFPLPTIHPPAPTYPDSLCFKTKRGVNCGMKIIN